MCNSSKSGHRDITPSVSLSRQFDLIVEAHGSVHDLTHPSTAGEQVGM
jgi:hypothetical protein